MPKEVFQLLYKGIFSRTNYGVKIVPTKPGIISIKCFSLRRPCVFFDEFEDCSDFTKKLRKGKGTAKLIVNSSNPGTMVSKEKDETLNFDFHYG